MEWKDFNTQGPSGSRQTVGPLARQPPKQWAGWPGRVGDQGGCSPGLWAGAAGWLPGESRGSEVENQGGRKHFVYNNPRVHCAFITSWVFTSISRSIPTEQWGKLLSFFRPGK